MVRLFLTAGAALLLWVVVPPTGSQPASAEYGRASWYALTSQTASGERCNPRAMTAAHKSLPFGTLVRVRNLKNRRWIVVRVNDRGPFHGGRLIDVTKAAAASLGFVAAGTAPVQLSIVD